MSQAVGSKFIPVQELSIQWLDLSRTAKYIGLKDISGAPLDEVAQKVVDTYNKEKEAEKSQTHYALQDTPAHDERDYQLKVYSYRDTRVTLLAQQVQTKPKNKSNSFYLLFFYKENPIRRMIAVTSSKAWSVVRHCINYEFPIRVAEKIANTQRIVQIVRFCLFGANAKETLLNPDQYELYKTQSLYYLVEAFRSEIRPNSSLFDLVGTCCLKITTGGLLRIEKKIPLEEYPPILDLFARYIEGEKTYNTEGYEETPEPLFEFLHFLQPAELLKGTLDLCLMRHVYRAHQKKQKQLIHVRHKRLEDFLFSTRFELKCVGKTFQHFGSRPPELETIINELDASDEADFVNKVKTCKLRFYDKDNQEQTAFLVDFFEGELRLANGDTYFKVRGMWYKLAANYLGLVHEDFKTLLKNGLIPKDAEGWLSRPWKGNSKGGKVTQDGVKDTLVSPKGIRKFIKDLKALTVCYVDNNEVMQQKLVGEILKNSAVVKHKDAIEKILKEKFSDQKVREACGEEADEVLNALKKKRKVVQKTPKATYVLNPFTYPMQDRPELKGKYDAFVVFLEKLYTESEHTENEETYNRAYLLPPFGPANGYLVFDQICPDNIEPCDVLRYTAETVYLYHVKEGFGQHTRDACSQIINSAKMIRSALATYQPQNYLQKLWGKATTLGKEPSDWLKSVKAQVEGLGEQTFLNIFRNRRIVFVYACLPDADKSLANEAKVKSCLAPEDLAAKEPIKLFAMLISLGYLDSHGRLTGKFQSTKKDNFKLTGELATSSEEVFKQLNAFRSVSKSTLAKIELLQLAQNLRALNFEFRIAEIPRANGDPVALSSLPRGTESTDNDQEDNLDGSQLFTPVGSMPPLITVSKIINGPLGYRRNGNTCYMIASFQLLFNIAPFRDLVIQRKNSSELTKDLYSILQEVEVDKTADLISILRDRVFQIAPPEILKGINRERAQHDAHEFLQFILEKLKWPMFSTRTKFITSKGNRYSDTESHFILSLPLSRTTFQETIDGYFAPEERNEPKDPYRAEFSSKTYHFTKWQQHPEMTTFPEFLFVQLKRFDNSGSKDSTKILFPLNGIVSIGTQRYEIIGFVNHHGSRADSGHYTADIKNLRDPSQEQWVHCDDDALRENTPNDPPSKAYLIALRKK